MRTAKYLLVAVVVGLLGCDDGSSGKPAVTCAECGNGSLDCDGDVSACLTQECVVTGTSLGEAVTLDSGNYTLTSPSGVTSGTFRVVDGGIALSQPDGPEAVLGVYQNTCPFN